jgi:hypothetical protein
MPPHQRGAPPGTGVAVITEFICTEADVGTIFPSECRFLLSLVRSRAPHNNHYRDWREKHFILRDTWMTQNLFCIPIDNGRTPLTIGGASYYLNNRCLQIYGDLELVACPWGSEWELTLSDIWVEPRKSFYKHYGDGYAPNSMWGSNRTPRNPPLPLTLAAPPLQIASPVAVPTERG